MNDLSNTPDYAAEIADQLTRDYGSRIATIASDLDVARLLPAKLETNEDVTTTADTIKKIRSHKTALDAIRTSEKEPHLRRGQAVDGFFKAQLDTIEKAVNVLNARISDKLRRDAEEERKRREAAAEAARKAADEARRKQDEEDRKAREAADKARQELARAEEAKMIATREKRIDAAQAHSDAADQGFKRAEEHAGDARALETQARHLEVAASAKPAELARTRSAGGALATLQTRWTYVIDDPQAVDLARLRPYISATVIDAAVKQYVRMGGRELAGVRIFQEEFGTVRVKLADTPLRVRSRAENAADELAAELAKGGQVKVTDTRSHRQDMPGGRVPWLAANILLQDGRAVMVRFHREKITMGPRPHTRSRAILTIEAPKPDLL